MSKSGGESIGEEKDKLVYIIGIGDLAREICHAIDEYNKAGIEKYVVRGFLDPIRSGKLVWEGLPVLAMDSFDASLAEPAHCIIGIGTPQYIRLARQTATAKGVRQWASVVHPRAYLSPGVELGKGVYVAAHATVAIATRLGDSCIVNQNVSIGHDVVIGRHSVVSPGCILSGKVELGDGVFLGSGAVLLPGVKIGAESQVSANCVVSHDVPPGVKVMPVTRNMELPREKATPSS